MKNNVAMIPARIGSERLKEKNLNLEISKSAINFIANKAFDPTYGARPLKREIRKQLETPISKSILKGEFSQGKTIRVDTKNDLLTFS